MAPTRNLFTYLPNGYQPNNKAGGMFHICGPATANDLSRGHGTA